MTQRVVWVFMRTILSDECLRGQQVTHNHVKSVYFILSAEMREVQYITKRATQLVHSVWRSRHIIIILCVFTSHYTCTQLCSASVRGTRWHQNTVIILYHLPTVWVAGTFGFRLCGAHGEDACMYTWTHMFWCGLVRFRNFRYAELWTRANACALDSFAFVCCGMTFLHTAHGPWCKLCYTYHVVFIRYFQFTH